MNQGSQKKTSKHFFVCPVCLPRITCAKRWSKTDDQVRRAHLITPVRCGALSLRAAIIYPRSFHFSRTPLHSYALWSFRCSSSACNGDLMKVIISFTLRNIPRGDKKDAIKSRKRRTRSSNENSER